jgi:hypothetical protein
MKIQKSSELSAFGGINFVFEFLEANKIGNLIESNLPELGNQSQYSWKDLIYSLMSVYMCGGDCIEDLNDHLKPHFVKNPFVKMPSPDTVLRRLGQLSQPNSTCRTGRGAVDHLYNTNKTLDRLNLKLLKLMGIFDSKEITLDYDNTIIPSEKSDCAMTYKRFKGYQPGVCTINENHVLYLENRGGNSDAKSFQHQTLERIFSVLETEHPKKPDHFRADGASYQYKVVRLLEQKVKNFYIGCRNSYIEKHFTEVKSWTSITTSDKEKIEVGEVMIKPFIKNFEEEGIEPREYRLIIKRTLNKTNQVGMFTQDTYDYRAILTNKDNRHSTVEVAKFYNQRGNMEKQFDILKNDFGWSRMPFSAMENNTVFLYLTAMFRNIYNAVIHYFSKKVKGLQPQFRMKKFIFRFIILPAKWVYRSRQHQLRVYGRLNFNT